MTRGFDEIWLKQHQAKVVAQTTPVDRIQFTLAKPVKLLNQTLRMHWAARSAYSKSLAAEIARVAPLLHEPMQKARVTVTRYSVREPDGDGLTGGCKQLIDCLIVKSKRHPHGLSYIVDDSPAHLEFEARHSKVSTLKAQGTTVIIERLD